MDHFSVRFWGVRGSVPAPITNAAIEAKLVETFRKAWMKFRTRGGHVPDSEFLEYIQGMLPFSSRATYGGNTTCVEVRCGKELIILDMGTGLRELGIGLLKEGKAKGLRGTILQSHVHWDHVQGFPFWKHAYMPRAFDNSFRFYGGKEWDKKLEEVLRLQMDPPHFPVEFDELRKTAMDARFDTVHDGMVITIPEIDEGVRPDVRITCRKLNHPQETYGWRIEYRGKSVAFCTDHEPYGGGDVPHRPLVELAKGADLFITDCQYTLDEYVGANGGVQKMGWGHSYPEYIAKAADAAKCRKVITTHHDPESSDERIEVIARQVGDLSGITSAPAYEGLRIDIE